MLKRITLTVWCLLVMGHLAWYLKQAFAAMPGVDEYANSVSFQLVAFGLTRLLFWLVGLLLVLLLEFFVFRRR